MSHPQALNEEQILQLMTNAIPAIARRLDQDEGWAFLMKQANRVKELETENASLKAEVERLTEKLQNEKSANANVECIQQDVLRGLRRNNERLEAQVERLTKAGDKMAHIHRFVGFPSYTLEWEAAKKGGQP